MEQSAIAIWSVVASIVSVILGILAIAISIHFFVVGRKTESAVSNSLTKIETQAQMLQRVTGRQLDRLTKFVTERPSRVEDVLPDLLVALGQLPATITTTLQQTSATASRGTAVDGKDRAGLHA